ncbi:hypothetical protein HUJ05_012644 [Dendroctonus ponderosae]|nr:hypothetical protein HUJ05_012644 [Dendroctonus ponderosae]
MVIEVVPKPADLHALPDSIPPAEIKKFGTFKTPQQVSHFKAKYGKSRPEPQPPISNRICKALKNIGRNPTKDTESPYRKAHSWRCPV